MYENVDVGDQTPSVALASAPSAPAVSDPLGVDTGNVLRAYTELMVVNLRMWTLGPSLVRVTPCLPAGELQIARRGDCPSPQNNTKNRRPRTAVAPD